MKCTEQILMINFTKQKTKKRNDSKIHKFLYIEYAMI
jgi:hypothetical protein